MASFLGLAIVVPTAVLVGTAALRQGDFEDNTREFYLTDSVVMAVISDLQRGADGDPVAPDDYIPPTVRFGDSVPNITVISLDAFLASLTDPVTGKPLGSQTVSTTRMVTYETGDQPVASVGAITVGGVPELKEDDGAYFRVTAVSNSSTTFSYEITSEPIGFSSVQFGEVKLKVRGWEESTTVEVFVFNPDDPASGSDGYRPAVSNLLDHHHALDEELVEKHKHDDDHEREAHDHDGLHLHGKDADKSTTIKSTTRATSTTPLTTTTTTGTTNITGTMMTKNMRKTTATATTATKATITTTTRGRTPTITTTRISWATLTIC